LVLFFATQCIYPFTWLQTKMFSDWRLNFLSCILFLLLGVSAEDVHAEVEDHDGDAEMMHDNSVEDNPSEFSEFLAKIHQKVDADGDGSLSLKELMDYSAVMRTQSSRRGVQDMMKTLDLDQNGKVSWEELNHKSEEQEHESYDPDLEVRKFEAADRNTDGQLNLLELSVFFSPDVDDKVLTALVTHQIERRDMDGDEMLNPVEFEPPARDKEAEEDDEMEVLEKALESYKKAFEHDPSSVKGDGDFALADKDGNGLLDLYELKAYESGHLRTELAMKTLFKLADKNRDDLITAEELAAVSERIAGSELHDHLLVWAEHAEL